MDQVLVLWPARSELFLLCAACGVVLFDVFCGKKYAFFTYLFVQASLCIGAVLTLYGGAWGGLPQLAFGGMFVQDSLAVVLKESIYLSALFAFAYARPYWVKSGTGGGEYFLLGLFSVLGMQVLVSAQHFITLFLGLELFSLPLYAMIALKREASVCVEAALKYFVMGALASGMLLYGLSLVYGVTHTLHIPAAAQVVGLLPLTAQGGMILFGLVFVVVGLGFKLGVVPFHMWVPDVYEGAPTPVVIFLGTAAKLAALGLVFRLLLEVFSSMSVRWQPLWIVIAVLSMAWGNLAAIVQRNVKRMLGYSSIAHMGYLSLGLLAATPNGSGAALFYMMTYALMTLAAFGVIAVLNYAGYEANEIDDLRGLHHRNPWLALMMLFALFSLAGVPPLLGFMAKLAVLESLVAVHLVWLAAVALLFAIIGAYYYIRVVKVMYFDAPTVTTPLRCAGEMRFVVSVSGLSLLVLGMVPGVLLTLSQGVFQGLWHF